MKLKELIQKLKEIEQEGHGDKEVDVFIETPRHLEYQCQYQYPLNRIAIARKTIVLMREEW